MTIKWNRQYPVRVRIKSVTGKVWYGIPIDTPEISKPHIGKEGVATLHDDTVTIYLDDGNVLYGHECWWEPVV